MRALILPLLIASSLALAGPLNDTGIDFCRDHATGADTTVTSSTTCTTAQGGQDARYGRDPAAQRGAITKTGGGSKGFDFTKIANNGTALPASAALGSGATDWACTYDNNTGLMWEVKVNDAAHLRHMGKTYTNYDNPAKPQRWNGSTYVNPTPAEIAAATNSIGFVNAVNAAGLCGHTDWRMPTLRELYNIADRGIAYPGPTIDATYFPNTPASVFWSGSPVAGYSNYAWNVNFYGGDDGWGGRNDADHVRLVRAGQ
jgi:hypothetical protein